MSAVVADRMGGDRHNPNVELIGAGHRQHRLAAVRRPAGDGRHRADRDQHPIGRANAGRGNGARDDAARSCCWQRRRSSASSRWRCSPRSCSWSRGTWANGRDPRAAAPHAARTSSSGLVTFGLTVFADLTLAVEVGMVLAALMFIRRVATTTSIAKVTPDFVEKGRIHILQDKHIPPYVSVFSIHGPFLFGATDKLLKITEHIDALQPIVILRLRNMTAIDATGLRAFEDLADRLRAVRSNADSLRRPRAARGRDETGTVPPARRRRQHLSQYRSRAQPGSGRVRSTGRLSVSSWAPIRAAAGSSAAASVRRRDGRFPRDG